MIAAIGAKRELGEGNSLIWKIPADLARLKNITLGHSIVMGRKTYESIGRILPNRTNIIITRDEGFKIDGAIVAHSLEEAIEAAKKSPGADEIFIFGGAQIFEQAIKLADKLYLTRINSEAPLADAYFPDYSEFNKITFQEKHVEDSLEYEFVEIEK